MTILFEAWRRAHGNDPHLAETLGAPAVTLRQRSPSFLWLLCLLLVALAAGLGVYVWLDQGLGQHRVADISAPPPQLRTAQDKPLTTSQPPAAPAPNALRSGENRALPVARPAPSTAGRPVSSASEAATRTLAAHGGAGAATRADTEPSPRVSTPPTIALAQVPDAVRKALPALAIVAHVWNADPDARFIVIGGRQFRAGEALAPGLRLIEITRVGEIVSFRGYRIALP